MNNNEHLQSENVWSEKKKKKTTIYMILLNTDKLKYYKLEKKVYKTIAH